MGEFSKNLARGASVPTKLALSVEEKKKIINDFLLGGLGRLIIRADISRKLTK